LETIAHALLPIITLILVGYALKRVDFMPGEAWAGMEKLTYFVLFPALLVNTLGRQDLSGAPWVKMSLVIVAVLCSIALLLFVLNRLWWRYACPTFTSVFQGSVRFNTYISLAVAQSLFGESGLAMASIAAGFMIVVINLLTISTFALCDRSKFNGAIPLAREILLNPLIMACLVGWFFSLSGLGISGAASDILDIIGQAALPFGLLAVGAALRPGKLGGQFVPLLVSSVFQFGVKPALVSGLILLTGLGGTAASGLLVSFMVPTATSSYILARQLGGDTEIMSSIITFETLIAFLLMPLIAFLLL
jgi:hypothetical protein